MADESKTPPPSESPKSVELDTVIGEQKTFSERGLQVVAVHVTPEAERPSGGGDIPPPVDAAPSGGGDQSGGSAQQEQSQPSE